MTILIHTLAYYNTKEEEKENTEPPPATSKPPPPPPPPWLWLSRCCCRIEATSASFGYGRQRLCEPNSMPIQSLSLISKRKDDATTGMWVADECKKSYMEMKWKKVHRYIVFKIDEQSKLVTVDKVGAAGEGYGDLEASLPDDDCRYAVFDFDFVTVDNCRKSKIFFIAWAPSASRIRAKILYATSKQGLRRVLEGIHYELQATDPTEMGFDVILDRAK